MEARMTGARTAAEGRAARTEKLKQDVSDVAQFIPGLGPGIKFWLDPRNKEAQGVNPLIRPAQSVAPIFREMAGLPNLEAQASGTLGPATRRGAMAQGQDLAELAAVPSTVDEEAYEWKSRDFSPGLLTEEEERERERIIAAARVRGLNEQDAIAQLGPRTVSRLLGAPAAAPPPIAPRPVNAARMSEVVSSEIADANQSGTDRFLTGSRTPLPTVYEEARKAGFDVAPAVVAEVGLDPLNALFEMGPLLRGGRALGQTLRFGDDLAEAAARGADDFGREMARPMVRSDAERVLYPRGESAPIPPPVPAQLPDRNVDRAIATLKAYQAKTPLSEFPHRVPTEEEALQAVRSLPNLTDVEEVAIETALRSVRRLPAVTQDAPVVEEQALRAVRNLPDLATLPEPIDDATAAALRAVRDLAPVVDPEEAAVQAVRNLPPLTTEDQAVQAVRGLKPVPPRDNFVTSRPPVSVAPKAPSVAPKAP